MVYKSLPDLHTCYSPQKAMRSGQPMQRGPRTFPYFLSYNPWAEDDHNVSPRVDSTSGQHPEHPHASQATTSPKELSRHLSVFASRKQIPDQRIELIVTSSAGLVWSGQHLEHNAQRQKPLRALLLTLLPPSNENFLVCLYLVLAVMRSQLI